MGYMYKGMVVLIIFPLVAIITFKELFKKKTKCINCDSTNVSYKNIGIKKKITCNECKFDWIEIR